MIRLRVANWALALPATGPRARMVADLHILLPPWIAAGCPLPAPRGLATMWAEAAGARASHAAEALRGGRPPGPRLLAVLPPEPPAPVEPDPREASCLRLLREGVPVRRAARLSGVPVCRATRIRDEAGIPPLSRGRKWK